MSAVAEAASLLREIAEPRPVGDSVKAAITRAARKVGIRAGWVEDIWRQEARAIRAEEMDAIRGFVQASRAAAKAEEDRKIMEAARAEARSFSDRLARLEALLLQDEDFHRPQIDALRGVAGIPHSARTEGGAK